MSAQRLQQSNRRHWLFSIILHLIILSFFIVSIEWRSTHYVVENATDNKVIEATLMHSSTEIKKIAPKPKPIKKIEPIPEKPKPIVPKTMPMPEKVVIIPDRKKEVAEKRAKQLLADLQRQTEKQKKQQQKELKELRQKQLETAFQKELAALEGQSLQPKKTALSAGVVNKYKALILQAIGQQWIVPPDANKKASAQLMIRLGAGGVVLDVQIVKGSGDPAVDRSARAAVFKASPLPVPTDPTAFAAFKEFILKVKPENIISNEVL